MSERRSVPLFALIECEFAARLFALLSSLPARHECGDGLPLRNEA